jgi:hypothetical protein
MGVVGFIDLFAPFRFLIESPPWVSFFVPGLVLPVALLVIGVIATAINPALGFISVLYVMIAWVGGVPITLAVVLYNAGVHDSFPLGLLVILGFMSNTVVAATVFATICWVLERFVGEEPVEAVESGRVKTYPPYEKTS